MTIFDSLQIEEINPIYVSITPSERLVLVELTRDGATNLKIAHRLGITEDTVKSHLRNVMRQLPHINNRTELAVALLRKAVRTKVSRLPGVNSRYQNLQQDQ